MADTKAVSIGVSSGGPELLTSDIQAHSKFNRAQDEIKYMQPTDWAYNGKLYHNPNDQNRTQDHGCFLRISSPGEGKTRTNHTSQPIHYQKEYPRD